MGSSAIGESGRYSAVDQGWSGRTHAAYPLGVQSEDSVVEGGSVAIRLGHGLGLSVGSSIGAGEAGGDGSSLGSSDDDEGRKLR